MKGQTKIILSPAAIEEAMQDYLNKQFREDKPQFLRHIGDVVHFTNGRGLELLVEDAPTILAVGK